MGNGLSAIFKAEMRFSADTGTLSTPQFAETYVGLKGSFGEVTVGRRLTITDDLFGYASNAKELAGSNLEGGAFNNNLAYRGTFGGLTVGADITTGENTGYVTTTGPYKAVGGRSYQYAAGAEYNFGAGAVAVGYEHNAVGKNAYALGLKYKVGPVEMFGRIARSTQSVNNFDFGGPNMDKRTRTTGWAAGLNYSITSNDVLGLSYSQANQRTSSTTYTNYNRAIGSMFHTNVTDRSRMLSLDYTHHLSKRTALYAGASIARVRSAGDSELTPLPGTTPTLAYKVPSYTSSTNKSFNLGLVHKF